MSEPDKQYKSDKQYPRLKRRRRRDSGHETWVYLYSFRGRDRCYTIGDVTLTQARKIAAGLQHEVALGKDPQAEKLAQRQAGTFGELADRYLEEHAKRKNKSWRQGRGLVERHLLPPWGKLDVKSITQADVYAALGKIASPTVQNQTLAAASAIFTWGVKVKVLAFNPCTGVETNPTKARSRVLSDSELQLIWRELNTALRTILLTGQRPGEVSCMRSEHIVDKVWWMLPGPEITALGWCGTKNSEDHRVFLAEPVRELIGTGTAGFVFERCRLHREMRRICKELKIEPKITPHDLRRSWTTFAARLGAKPSQLDRVLNHVAPRRRSVTATTYNQYRYETEDAALMEKVAAHIMELAEGRRDTGTVIRGTFLNEAS
jgi:integrase